MKHTSSLIAASLLRETLLLADFSQGALDEEIAALPADVKVFHVEPLQVPGLDAERCVIWLKLAS